MATVTVSIGSNQSIDTETTESCSGSGPWVTVFGTTPSGIAVGDLATGSDSFGGTFIWLVTAISGDNITLKYISGGMSATSPCAIGSFGGGGVITFKRYYSTITLWEAGLDSGLYSSSDDAVGECYNDSVFNESVTINGGGTVGLDSRTLSVASGQRHDGTAGNGARMVQSGNNSGRVIVSIANTTVEWLELNCGGYRNDNGVAYNTDLGSDTADSTPWTCQRCIVHNLDGSSNQRGIDNTSKGDGKIQNNIIYNIAGSSNTVWGIRAGRNAARNIYNNTVHDIDGSAGAANVYGILVGNSSAINVKNNISTNALGGSSVNECYSEGASVSPAYNLSSDATASGTGSLTSKAAADQFVSTTGGSEDLHLKDEADALRAGVDLGTSPAGVNIDIDGRDRDSEGDDWDMGADQCEGCSEAGAAATANPAFLLMFID